MCVRSYGHATSANVDMIEQTDLEDVYSLQFVQWTLPQFSLHVLDNVLRCLHGPCVDDQLSMQCLELIHQAATLLTDSLTPAALWEDTSMPACELVCSNSSDSCTNFPTSLKSD